MKKGSMIIAVVVSIISAQGVIAQEELVENNSWKNMNYQNEVQEYAEIGGAELPISVEDSIVKDFQNYQIHKTYISKDNTYKVILEDKNNFKKVVFTNASGTLIKPNNKS